MSLVFELPFSQKIPAVQSYEGGIEALLCLAPHVLKRSGEEDDHLVAGVGRFANESRIRRSLAGLDVPTPEPPALPRACILRVAEEIEQVVHRPVKCSRNPRGPPVSHEQLMISVPVERIDPCAAVTEPGNVLFFDGLAEFHPNSESGVKQLLGLSNILRPVFKRFCQPLKNQGNLLLSRRRLQSEALGGHSCNRLRRFVDVHWRSFSAIRFAAAGSRLNGSVIASLSNSRAAIAGWSTKAATIRRANTSNSLSSRADASAT